MANFNSRTNCLKEWNVFLERIKSCIEKYTTYAFIDNVCNNDYWVVKDQQNIKNNRRIKRMVATMIFENFIIGTCSTCASSIHYSCGMPQL